MYVLKGSTTSEQCHRLETTWAFGDTYASHRDGVLGVLPIFSPSLVTSPVSSFVLYAGHLASGTTL
jgi:hypothetical protein